jgi:membrane protein implicated in regulation of membrane protease activity
MTWSEIYLLCFLVGFSLSVLSFLAGAVHIHLPFNMHSPFHLGHMGWHVGTHVGGHAGGHAGAGHGAAHSGTGHASSCAVRNSSARLPWFNAITAMAFLAWFGGVGYILTNYSHLVALVSLSIASGSGLFAGFLVFRFMARLMRSSNGEMNDWDYRLEGAIGTISMPIRARGTGEIIFEQDGARRSIGARCESGAPIPKGTEVVIERYEHGIAYVKPWDEFTK